MIVTVIGSEGFVGGAMTKVFLEHGIEVIQIDKKRPSSFQSYDAARSSSIIFICVPTPYSPVLADYDYSAIRDVLSRLSDATAAICIRSTIAPDFTHPLAQVHCPEFLRARYAYEDFKKPDLHIYGADDNRQAISSIQRVYRECDIKPAETIHCSFAQAAALKLTHNVYRAQRIAFLNELYLAAEHCWGGWASFGSNLTTMFRARQFGGHYLQVPGPDGKFGFGGACFPKDLAAFINYLERCNLPHDILDAVRVVNSKMRLQE